MFFGKNAKSTGNANAGNLETLIGKSAQFKGDLRAVGVARIDGAMEGSLQIEGDLFVGAGGVVQAEVKAKNATIAGRIKGNIQVSGKVELLATANVAGDISAQAIMVEEGAKFNGRSQIIEAVTPPATPK